MMAKLDDTQPSVSSEEAAAISSLSMAARLVEDTAYSLAKIRPSIELTSLFLLAASLEKEINRISEKP